MLCRIIASVLVAVAALPQPHRQTSGWDQIASTLVAGDTLIVERDRHPALIGRYVSADINRLTLWVDASEHAVNRDEVARVIKLSRPHRHGVLVGALVGAGIAGAIFATGEDLTAAGRAMWVAIGAASGAAIGLRADRYRKREVVYVR